MVKGFKNFVCRQKDKRKKCIHCEYLEKCKTYEDVEEKKKKERLEDEKKHHKCFNCVWAHKENMYCPFVNCMKER